jgi:hypothetical protein
MGWKIVERSVLPKDLTQGPEDAIYESESDWCTIVIDTHSNRCKKKIDDATAGQYVAAASLAELRALEEADNVTYKDFVPRFSKGVGRWVDLAFPGRDDRPGLVFAGLFPTFGECGMIIRVGDCQYLIDGEGRNRGLAIERKNAEVRGLLLRDALKRGSSIEDLQADDPTCARMSELIRDQAKYRNTRHEMFGFGVINGEEVPTCWIECIPVPTDAREIILASDGYPEEALSSSLEETERKLKEILAEDPLCIHRWPSVRGLKPGFDRTDDCTYIRLVRT